MRGFAFSALLFVVVTFVSGYALALADALWQPDWIELHSLAPMLGALAVVLFVPAKLQLAGPAPVARRQWLAHSILGVGAAVLFAVVLGAALWLQQLPFVALDRLGVGSIVGAVVMALLAALTQEIGWRGTLQPLLESRMPRLGAATVTGLLWSLFVMGFAVHLWQGLLYALTYVSLGILLGYLGNGSVAQRVATAALVHWLISLAITFLAGLSGDAVLAATAAAAVVVTVLFMALFVIATKRRAARTGAAQQPAASPETSATTGA